MCHFKEIAFWLKNIIFDFGCTEPPFRVCSSGSERTSFSGSTELPFSPTIIVIHELCFGVTRWHHYINISALSISYMYIYIYIYVYLYISIYIYIYYIVMLYVWIFVRVKHFQKTFSFLIQKY